MSLEGMTEKEQNTFFYKLHRKFRKAVELYGLIEEGDKILVGLSGGKDSLALVEFLGEKMKVFKPRFSVVAVHVAMSNIKYESDLTYLKNYAESFGIELILRETSFDMATDHRKSPCFLCSWNRRKTLFEVAKEHGCNKIALGHHKDDLVETLLMNLIFQGSMSTIPPLLQMEKMPIQMIRPLCLIEEKDITQYAELSGYQKQTKLCPLEKVSSRAEVKQLLSQLEALNPNVRDSIWSAMENIKSDYLPRKAQR
jgi:tRNA(Ile)-lysidine synthase TilS/MesJ